MSHYGLFPEASHPGNNLAPRKSRNSTRFFETVLYIPFCPRIWAFLEKLWQPTFLIFQTQAKDWDPKFTVTIFWGQLEVWLYFSEREKHKLCPSVWSPVLLLLYNKKNVKCSVFHLSRYVNGDPLCNYREIAEYISYFLT